VGRGERRHSEEKRQRAKGGAGFENQVSFRSATTQQENAVLAQALAAKERVENILVHAILLHLRRPHKKPSRVLLAAYGGGKYGGADNCYIPSDAR
jgi:hypothetical protein